MAPPSASQAHINGLENRRKKILNKLLINSSLCRLQKVQLSFGMAIYGIKAGRTRARKTVALLACYAASHLLEVAMEETTLR